MPTGIIEWGTTPKDFFERKTAMMWTTTGNLTNVKNNAKFDFGVAMLPAGKRRGSPTGGGNFYIFKKSTPAQQAASLKFIKWITSPERAAAQWGIDTGYVAVRPDAWETPAMKQYVAGLPAAAVARDQLPYAVAELSTHDNQRVTKALNDGLQAALTGAKTPEQAMKDAQREADRILRPIGSERRRRGRPPTALQPPGSHGGAGFARAHGPTPARADRVMSAMARPVRTVAVGLLRGVHVIGWLLLLPAVVLLVAFTHYPMVATLYHSLFSDAEAGAAVGVGGARQLPGDGRGPGVLAGARQQSLVRARHHSAVDRAGAADGGVGQRADRGARAAAPGLLHAHRAADDRGGQHLALLLHAGLRPARADHRALRPAEPQLARAAASTALGCLIVVTVWKEAGFFMIFYLAALQSISPHLGEAAALKGAGRWYFFRRVTFPLLMPTTLFVLVNAVINSFRLVDHIVVMTKGGPDNATALLLYYIYEVGFKFWDQAYAAALTVVLLVILAAVALGQFLFLDRRVHYQ